MYTVTNMTSGPYKIDTIDGPVMLTANGSVTANFQDAYLERLKSFKAFEVMKGGDPVSAAGGVVDKPRRGRPRKEHSNG